MRQDRLLWNYFRILYWKRLQKAISLSWKKFKWTTKIKNKSNFQRVWLFMIYGRSLDFKRRFYTLKGYLVDALDELNMTEIDRIRDDCLKSEHYRIKQFWRTIKRWYDWIKGFCEHSTDNFKFTNALTEGINNLCKVAKRVSHWFSSKVMYIKKLTARFCLKKLEI